MNYGYLVDLLFAGVVGVACYFWFSGHVWCRFACPLAALMHIYARFSRFGILDLPGLATRASNPMMFNLTKT